MKTEDLISLLSTGVTPVDPRVSTRRFDVQLYWVALARSC